MVALRLLLHSFVLALANIIFIIAGFGIYHLLKPTNQIAVQAPSAALMCIIAFLLWSLLVRRFCGQDLLFQDKNEFAWAFLMALLWSPVIFVPFHYIARGYLTSFGNMLAIWLFQIPTNFLALVVVKTWFRSEDH